MTHLPITYTKQPQITSVLILHYLNLSLDGMRLWGIRTSLGLIPGILLMLRNRSYKNWRGLVKFLWSWMIPTPKPSVRRYISFLCLCHCPLIPHKMIISHLPEVAEALGSTFDASIGSIIMSYVTTLITGALLHWEEGKHIRYQLEFFVVTVGDIVTFYFLGIFWKHAHLLCKSNMTTLLNVYFVVQWNW